MTKLSDTFRIFDDIITVTTTSRFMLMRKPHSVVIPLRLGGRPTLQLGVLIEYTTTDSGVLEDWHHWLCADVSAGGYQYLFEQAQKGELPLDQDEQELTKFVKTFRCR